MKKIDFRHYATERLSNFVFYVLIGIIVVLALLFRLVGFDMPYEYNFDYNAPVRYSRSCIRMACRSQQA